MPQKYDVIVVGARCAGSPTAMLLARRGQRVLLVDRDDFPSDTVSTHLLHAPGVAALARWGLLEDLVATGCPPITEYRYDFGAFTVAGRPRPTPDGVDVAYGPRRTVLDQLLLEAAGRAGVDVRTGFQVQDLLVEDGQVVGIRGRAGGLGRRTGGGACRPGDRRRRPALAGRRGRGRGLFLLTVSITYLVSVVSAEVMRRSLAIQVHALGGDATEIVLRGWDGERFTPMYQQQLIALGTSVGTSAEQHRPESWTRCAPPCGGTSTRRR